MKDETGGTKKLTGLSNQKKRLESAQKLLHSENGKIKQFEDFLTTFPRKSKDLPNPQFNSNTQLAYYNSTIISEIDAEQIESLNCFVIPTNTESAVKLDVE